MVAVLFCGEGTTPPSPAGGSMHSPESILHAVGCSNNTDDVPGRAACRVRGTKTPSQAS